jgi:hypothetical protein
MYPTNEIIGVVMVQVPKLGILWDEGQQKIHLINYYIVWVLFL